MNRIYKVVFNKTIGAYTAVSELASFKGKKSVKAAVAVGLAGLMMAGTVSAAGLSGGKDGSPNPSISGVSYTGTDSSSGEYVASGGAVTADAVTVEKDLYGGYDYVASGSESRAMASSNNTVTVTNGSDLGSKYVRGGTVSAASDVTVTSVTASGNGITVEEDSVANRGNLWGARVDIEKEVTGTLTVDGNTVDVTGKSAADTKFVSVYGADVYGKVGGDVSVSGNKVTVSKATVGTDYVQTFVAAADIYVKTTTSDGVNLKADKNEAGLTDVAFTEYLHVYGANIELSGTAKDVSLSENKVTLDKSKTTGGDIYGASVEAGSATASGSFDLKKNEVTVTGISKTDTSLEVAFGVSAAVKMASGSITASENQVSLTDTKLSGDGDGYGVAAIVSVSATGDGEVNVISEKNTLTAKGADATSDFIGAYVGLTGDEKINRVTIDGNTATVENGELWGNVTGADFYIGVYSGDKVTVGSAEVKNNKATVKGVTATNIVGAGVKGDNVTLSGNAADVSDNSDVDFVAGASAVGDGATLTGNAAKVTDSTVQGGDDGVYGAEVQGNNAVVTGNTATVNNSQVLSHMVSGNEKGGNVQGAEVIGDNATMSGNTANVTDGSSAKYVSGAYAKGEGAKLTDNVANVSDSEVTGTDEADGVIAAEAVGNNAVVTGNTANVSDSEVTAYVQGGEAVGDNATMSGNTANVTDGSSAKYVSGAYAKGDGAKLTDNVANVSGSEVTGADIADGVIAAEAVGNNAVVTGNTANVSNSQVTANIQGGEAVGDNATMSGNTANVSNGSSARYVSGAYAKGENSQVTGNIANVSDSNVNGEGVYGAEVEGNNAVVSNNTANVSGSTVDGNVLAANVDGNNAVVTGNTTNVKDSDVKYWADGADVVGDNATVSGNTVNVGGNSTIGSGIFGGYADGKDATLSNNTVNLSGNTVFNDGAIVYAAGDEDNDSSVKVTDNTVNVTDNVKLSNVDMYGRNSDNQGSGNKLNLNNWKGEIKSVNYFDNVNVNTSSAEAEQVVIDDLNKGNADTQIGVNLDKQGTQELERNSFSELDAVQKASDVVKFNNVDGSAEHNEAINVHLAEGDLLGEVNATVMENGGVAAFREKENSIISSLRMIGANNFLVFRQQMNDLEKRMGDLRTMPQSDGAWARVVAGQAEYKGLHSTYKTVQAGADKRIGQFVIGATASYTDADGTMKRLGTDDKNYTYGIYGSWLGDNGHFVDVILKRHHVASEFDARYADGRKVDGSTHTSGTSLSVEYGKRFGITNTNFYVEPQVEVMWGKLDSDSYKLSNGVKVSQDSIDSFIGRLGVAAGWVSPEKKGSAYIKASILNDWEADAEMKAKKGGIVKKFHEDMGGTWGEFVIGGTYNFNKSFSAYGEIETSAGNPTKTTYQASAGIRYSF